MNREHKKQLPTSTPEIGRIMPQARELEEAIIGAVLIEKTAFEAANNIFSLEMFYVDANRLIFEACSDLEAERNVIDMLTVIERLLKNRTLEAVGGMSYIALLSQKVLSSFHLEYHCLLVKDKYLHRWLIEVCSSNIDLGFDDTEDIDETITKLNADIERLQESIVGKKDTSHISEAAKKSIEQMHIRIANRINGITPEICRPGQTYKRMAARKICRNSLEAGSWETSIAIKLARKAAKHGTLVAFFRLRWEKQN